MTALPPELTIDDLTFADLLRIALEDLPGASGGAWTLHGAVDPGITLLELFAWRSSSGCSPPSRSPSRMVRAGLRLLGLGDLRTRPGGRAPSSRSVAAGAARPLPAGAGHGPAGRRRRAPVRLPTTTVDVLPVHGVTVVRRRPRAGDRLDLVLDRDGPILRDADALAAGRRRAHDAVVPACVGAGASTCRHRPTLEWTAVGPDGAQQPVVPEDGTGGLRRSGLLRVAWPEVWNRVGGRRVSAAWRPCVAGFFTEPVRFRAVHANAVVARHLVPGACRRHRPAGRLCCRCPASGCALPRRRPVVLHDGAGRR